jgi:hypothetical protein
MKEAFALPIFPTTIVKKERNSHHLFLIARTSCFMFTSTLRDMHIVVMDELWHQEMIISWEHTHIHTHIHTSKHIERKYFQERTFEWRKRVNTKFLIELLPFFAVFFNAIIGNKKTGHATNNIEPNQTNDKAYDILWTVIQFETT